MIPYEVVKTLYEEVPNYHLLNTTVASESFTLCACKNCGSCLERDDGVRICYRVSRWLKDEGYAVVAWNGTCDKAHWWDREPPESLVKRERKAILKHKREKQKAKSIADFSTSKDDLFATSWKNSGLASVANEQQTSTSSELNKQCEREES